MSEWILILTLFSYKGGAAIEHISFPTKESCLAAGNAFVQQDTDYHAKTALCVPRPKVTK